MSSRIAAPSVKRSIESSKKPLGSVPTVTAVDQVNTSFLETLLGYNARRAALTIIEVFLERMTKFGLRPVDFSVMSVIEHNPGVTSRQLGAFVFRLSRKLSLLFRSPHTSL